jgi:hypothetical protein
MQTMYQLQNSWTSTVRRYSQNWTRTEDYNIDTNFRKRAKESRWHGDKLSAL